MVDYNKYLEAIKVISEFEDNKKRVASERLENSWGYQSAWRWMTHENKQELLRSKLAYTQKEYGDFLNGSRTAFEKGTWGKDETIWINFVEEQSNGYKKEINKIRRMIYKQ